MNINWMDNVGVINDLYRIKHFDLIEKSSDIPLMWFDTIRDCIIDAKKQERDYIDFETVVKALVQNKKMDKNVFDNICATICNKYTSRCIYLNHIYTEWRVTDLFSSIVCYIQMSIFIDKILNDKRRDNGIRTYLLGRNTYATNIYTNDSNIVFDLTKRYHKASIVKDMDLDNPDRFDLAITDVAINRSFDVCLLIKKNDEIFEVVLPLVGYKVLVEENIKEGDEDYDVLSITFGDLGLELSINE